MIILIALLLAIQAEAQSCLDDSGKAVDWWIILKLPKDKAENPDGKEYLYCDSDTDCDQLEWIENEVDNSTLSPLALTIKQINFRSTTTLSILWSDQPPNSSTSHSSKGHSKGILSVSNTSAFVIQHSAPRFPEMDPTNRFIVTDLPPSATINGQHFFCASISTNDAEQLANQLTIAGIIAYRFNTVSIRPKLDNLNLAPGRRGPTVSNGNVLISAGRFNLMVFSKTDSHKHDFYHDIIAPQFKIGFLVATWGSGHPGLQPAVCKDDITHSVLDRSHYGFRFSYTKDHSKFGISIDSRKPYICFSDLNRMVSQNNRGGIAMCFESLNLWNILNGAFVNRQGC